MSGTTNKFFPPKMWLQKRYQIHARHCSARNCFSTWYPKIMWVFIIL